MKKIILALAFMIMPTVTILANSNLLHNLSISELSVTNSQVEGFFKTENFSKLSKNFHIKKEDFDLNSIEIIKVNEISNLIRIKVYKESRVDYVTLMPDNLALYEKTLINESGDGSIEQYEVNGTLIANFQVRKNEEGKFDVKLNYVNNTVTSLGDQLSCVKKTYNTIKSTCESDTTCSIACDLSPQCAIVMYGVAAAHCAASGNQPATMSQSTN